MADKTLYFCQRCGNKLPKDKLKEVTIPNGPQKGLVLQLCNICGRKYDRPKFMNGIIYK